MFGLFRTILEIVEVAFTALMLYIVVALCVTHPVEGIVTAILLFGIFLFIRAIWKRVK